MHQGTGNRDTPFEGVTCRLRAELIRQRGQQAEVREHCLFPSVHQHEAAGAVGILRFSWLEAGLTDQSGLLIAEIAGDCNSLNGRRVRGAIDFAARNNLRQHLDGNAEFIQYVPIPLERVEVHQLGAAGIGHVGYVDAAMRPTSEMPDQKSIDIAKQKIAGFSLCACACNLFENPANLKATEISRERKAGLAAIAVLSATRSEFGYRGSNTRVLPDNRVVNGLPTFLVPDHGGFALVGDSDRSQVFRP